MFGNFTQKISTFLLDRMKNSKKEEVAKFIHQLLTELKNILLNEDVHPKLVEAIINDGKSYLENNKNELFNKNHLIKNLLKNLLAQYIIEDHNLILKKKIILIGDNGNGKTTIASKLSAYLAQEDFKVAVIHQDPFRYGSYEQLIENLESTPVTVYKSDDKIQEEYDYEIIDTAGFSSWTPEYEKTIVNQDASYIFVGSCLIGSHNFNLIEKIIKIINIDGIIITNCDGEARSGLFLSASYLIQKPILFISDNEQIVSDDFNNAIIPFHKDTILKRLVGLYDETGFQKAIDKISKKNNNLMDRLLSGVFDYETMEEFLEGIIHNKFNSILGSLGNLQTQNDQQKVMMKKMLLVIQSMTLKEKKNPSLFKGPTGLSRMNRIARGTQMNTVEVAHYIESINMMINTFSNFTNGGMADLENLTDVEEMKEKFSDPEFIKKYINNKENMSFDENISFDEKNNYNHIMSDEEKNNMTNGAEGMANPFTAGMPNGEIPEDMINSIRMIKGIYTPAQLIQMIKSIPKDMLKSTPFGQMDPKMMDMILTEQNIQMLYDMVK